MQATLNVAIANSSTCCLSPWRWPGCRSSELGKNFNEDQIEVRVYTLRHAYRAARQFAREIVHGGNTPGATS